jgi:hypothetical protein
MIKDLDNNKHETPRRATDKAKMNVYHEFQRYKTRNTAGKASVKEFVASVLEEGVVRGKSEIHAIEGWCNDKSK